MSAIYDLFFDLPATATSSTWLPYALVGFMALIAMCDLITNIIATALSLGRWRV